MKKITNKSRFGRIQIEMIRAIVSFALVIAANIPITNSIPGWKTIMQKLKTLLAEIDDLKSKNSVSLKQYALQKKTMKAALIEQTVPIMSAVYNYLLSINDPASETMIITKSKLEEMSYEGIVNFVNGIIPVVEPLVPSLTNFDVTQQQVDDWEQTNTGLDAVLGFVKNYYANRKSNNKIIQQKLRECMILLYQQGDTFITKFEKDNVAYFNSYWANRKLQPLSMHTKFKVKITSDMDAPIFNAKIQQDGTDNFTATDINGDATLRIKVKKGKDVQPVYSFTISSDKHSIKTGNIEIKLGESVTRSYTIAESGFIIPAPEEIPENMNA